ncbi:MAG: SDR family oxidoreductase [Christensenellaceae bacterium]|jgi:gluconate 5-dehydrogenase|nr:SDR family oxidoreductase [Christensenellaceae bacterium]
MFELTGKKAIITGASSGLGVQFAIALAKQGADVALLARRIDKLQEVKAQVEAYGVKALAIKCDVTDTANIKAAVAEVHTAFGRIDILVNNAGNAFGMPAELQTDEDWLKVINVNLNGVFFTAREVGKIMKAQKYGKIINIGSIHSGVAMSGLPIASYCATKGAVLMLTKELAVEWAKFGITVNAIGPGYFASEMTQGMLANEGFQKQIQVYCPMGRVGEAGELDGSLIYFASDASRFTTGQILWVDGGWTAI